MYQENALETLAKVEVSPKAGEGPQNGLKVRAARQALAAFIMRQIRQDWG